MTSDEFVKLAGIALSSGVVSGVVVESVKRFLDGRSRRAKAAGHVLTAVTKLELEFRGLEDAAGQGAPMGPFDTEQKALEAFALAVGEVRMDLTEKQFGAAMLVFSELDTDLALLREGKIPTFMWQRPGDLAVDPVEHLLEVLGAQAPLRLWKAARVAAEKLPKVPPETR